MRRPARAISGRPNRYALHHVLRRVNALRTCMTGGGRRHRRGPSTKRNDAMKCPDCGYARTQVKDTRTAEDGTEIRRKRKCPRCNGVIRTYEITADSIDQVAADMARIRAERDNALASLKTPGVSDGQDVEAVSCSCPH